MFFLISNITEESTEAFMNEFINVLFSARPTGKGLEYGGVKSLLTNKLHITALLRWRRGGELRNGV